MDLIIRAKEPYEKIMKRESHLLFTQETKFSYEFWNLKKGIPTLISEKVNLHISNSHSPDTNSLTQRKQVQHAQTICNNILCQERNNQWLKMKGLKGAELCLSSSSGLLQTLFTFFYKEKAFWLCIIIQQNSLLLI